MKTLNFKWLWLFIAVYFAIGLLVQPSKCLIQKELTAESVRLNAKHVDAPLTSALQTIGSLYTRPSCFAPVMQVKGTYGWSYTTAEIVREKAYQTYLMWIRIICAVLFFNFAWITCFTWYQDRKK